MDNSVVTVTASAVVVVVSVVTNKSVSCDWLSTTLDRGMKIVLTKLRSNENLPRYVQICDEF